MNTAYKQEKKRNAKRRGHVTSSMISEPLYCDREPPLPKKLKESLYLSFPVETVLATDQSGTGDMKTELEYNLEETVQ